VRRVVVGEIGGFSRKPRSSVASIQFEPAQPILQVVRKANLAVLAVVDHINADLTLMADHLLHGTPYGASDKVFVDGFIVAALDQ
jgi:hypothetical protein